MWSFDWAIDPLFPYTWRFNKAEAGTGALGDLGVYLIDAAIWLLGGITSVCADLKTIIPLRPIVYEKLHFGDIRQKHKEGSINTINQQAVVENDDVCRLMIQFADQGTGTITASRLHAEQSIRIECDKGTFFWRLNTDQLVSRKPGEKD